MTLFDKYGGYETFAQIVRSFYRAVLDEPTLQPYFAGVDMARLMRHQTDFLSTALGGPTQYFGGDLGFVHAHLHITPADFQLVSELLRDALEDAGVEEKDVLTVMHVVSLTAAAIVSEPAT